MLFLDHEEVERFIQITWDVPKLDPECIEGASGQVDHQLGWAITPTPGEDAARLNYYAASPPRTIEWLQEQDAEAWDRAAAEVPQDRRGHTGSPVDAGRQRNAHAGSPNGSPGSPKIKPEAFDRASLFQPAPVARTVRRTSASAPSGLAGLVSVGQPGGAALQEIPTDAVALKLYLPDRSSTTVHVSEKASTEDVLRAVVSKVGQDSDLAGKLHGATAADCELRMHEGDGEPEDFAIDKSAQICSFGEDEFCVCLALDRVAAAVAPTVDFVQEMDGHVAIAFPNNEIYTIRIEDGWTTTMLLLRLEEKVPKLKQLAQEYVLCLNKEDQARLRISPLDGGRLAPDTDVSSLNVSELALERRFFADAPNVNLKRVSTSRPAQAPAGGSSQHRPQDLYWRKYNDITAPLWEEWQVHKINQRGKAQRRMMGIGRDNVSGQLMVTNAKLDNSKRIGDVHTRCRLLTTLLKVDLLAEEMSGLPQTAGGASSTVRISWDEDGAEYVIKYVAGTPEAAMLIVCKILYLREMERKNSAAASKMRRLTHADA